MMVYGGRGFIAFQAQGRFDMRRHLGIQTVQKRTRYIVLCWNMIRRKLETQVGRSQFTEVLYIMLKSSYFAGNGSVESLLDLMRGVTWSSLIPLGIYVGNR